MTHEKQSDLGKAEVLREVIRLATATVLHPSSDVFIADALKAEREPLVKLLRDFHERFHNYDDAGPKQESWQSEPFMELLEATKAAIG